VDRAEKVADPAGEQLTSENGHMPDVSLYVAAITAGAALLGGGISIVPVYLRDIRQARQDRRDRRDDTRRQACIDLLSAAEDLRTAVANAADYRGPEMPARLAQIRTFAGAVQVHAANIELLAPRTLADPADALAKAAAKFAAEAAMRIGPELNQMVTAPEAGELSEAIEAFRKQSVLEVAR
jgi:hypothetical protein